MPKILCEQFHIQASIKLSKMYNITKINNSMNSTIRLSKTSNRVVGHLFDMSVFNKEQKCSFSSFDVFCCNLLNCRTIKSKCSPIYLVYYLIEANVIIYFYLPMYWQEPRFLPYKITKLYSIFYIVELN